MYASEQITEKASADAAEKVQKAEDRVSNMEKEKRAAEKVQAAFLNHHARNNM